LQEKIRIIPGNWIPILSFVNTLANSFGVRRADAWKERNRRLFDYYRAFAPQLPESFRDMEPLFLALICGCNAGLYREALHEVYIPRIQRGDAFFRRQGSRSQRNAALDFGIFFRRRTLGARWVETGRAGESLAAEDKVFILMQAGLYLTATRGFGVREAQICYNRIEALCDSVNGPRIPHSALIGEWRYSLVTDKLSETMRIAKTNFLASPKSGMTPALMMEGLPRFGRHILLSRRFSRLAREYTTRGLQIWRSGGVQSQIEEVTAHPVAYLYYKAIADWHFRRDRLPRDHCGSNWTSQKPK